MTADVSASLKAGSELDAIGYGLDSKRVLRLAKKAREAELAAKLELLKASGRPPDARRMVRSQTTGAWLTATPSSDFGTALSSTEFRYSLPIRHGLTPLGLASHCDACPQARFTVGHALQCKIGGLIRARHEAVAAEWHQLCAAAFTPSAVTDEPEIPMVHTATESVLANTGTLRGDVSAHGFWAHGTTAIFDIRVTDTDAASNRSLDPSKILRKQEREKKDKYSEACLAVHKHFTPLVYLVDRMEGGEAVAARKRLASRLAAKWNRNYAQVCSFVRSRLSFTLVRSTSRCLRGTRNPHQRHQGFSWAEGAGLRLYSRLV